MAKRKRDKCPQCKGTGHVPEPSPFDVVWPLHAQSGFAAQASIIQLETTVAVGREVQPWVQITFSDLRTGDETFARIPLGDMDTLIMAWHKAKRLTRKPKRARRKAA